MLGLALGIRIEHQQSAIGQNEYRLVDQLRPNSHKVLFPELQLNAFGDLEHLLSVFQSLLQGRLDLFNQFGLLFYLPFVAHPFDLGKNRRQIPVDVLIQRQSQFGESRLGGGFVGVVWVVGHRIFLDLFV